MIAPIVYVLCSLMSLLVAGLLWRNYRRTGVRFLLWSSLCFFGLGLGNVTLFLDLVIFADTMNLSIVRMVPSILGYGALLYGFIWDVV